MRICFLDQSPLDYTVLSPNSRSLGGSQSALAYLAQALTKKGPQIMVATHCHQPGVYAGIEHCSPLSEGIFRKSDILVCLNHWPPQNVEQTLPIIFWNQHNRHDPLARHCANPTYLSLVDRFVFVSQQQKQAYLKHYPLPATQAVVIRNAMAPSFEYRFDHIKALRTKKKKPLTLAYISTPGRGLDILLAVFPALKSRYPHICLKVYSSLEVYQTTESQYFELYQFCQNTMGIEYIGSLPQPKLAKELESIHILAYPNTFEETSCIAAIEALASGCRIVSTNFGALPETTGGFARLVNPVRGPRFAQDFFDALCSEIEAYQTAPPYDSLWKQIQWANQTYRWSDRAQEWLNLFESLAQ